jgi:hypothetical protein
MRFQTLTINGKSSIRRYSPAPPALNACACSVVFNCPDPFLTGGPFICQYGDNCTNGSIVWTVPGISTGCTYYERLLGSDLRCFFNRSCINTMLAMYNVDMPKRSPLPSAAFQFTPLDSSIRSRFPPTTKIETIFREFMLEDWSVPPYFEGYYRSCAPAACTFTITRQWELLYVVSTIISFFGGLVVVLRLLVPILVRSTYGIGRRWRHRRSNDNAQQLSKTEGETHDSHLHVANAISRGRLNRWKRNMKRWFSEMNFFHQESSINLSPNATQMAIMSSRVYAVLLPMCLCVLVIFYSFGQQSISRTILSPSLADFERLEVLYPATLSCPCQQIAIPFSRFSSVNFTVHQVSCTG